MEAASASHESFHGHPGPDGLTFKQRLDADPELMAWWMRIGPKPALADVREFFEKGLKWPFVTPPER